MKKIRLLLLLAGTIAMMLIVQQTGKELKTPVTPKGILNLEFAYDTIKTRAITMAWSPINAQGQDLITVAKKNTWYDFGFLFFYSLFLYCLCYMLAKQLPRSKRIGRLLGRGAILAGVLDTLENTGMLITLDSTHENSIATATTFFAAVKWMLALLAVLYVLIAGAIVIVLYIRRKG